MKSILDNEFLWIEKYRPQNIDDCILPDELKSNLKAAIASGQIQNMLFAGTAGLGKTTAAKAICKMLDVDYLFINASEDSGIDILRNKIRQFASSISLNGGYKVVILDEADYLNATSTQVALRGFIEEFSNNCRFILTCNFKNKLIEPLHSRLGVIEFNTSKKDLANLAAKFMDRMSFILEKENVQYDKQVLAELIIRYAPDWRRVIGECQRHSTSGKLLPTCLTAQSDESFKEMIGFLKDKDFKSMRGWAANNTSLDGVSVFRRIYDSMYDVMKPASIPGAVIVLADYSYKSAFVADKELNLVACLTELMSGVEWK